jgi:hypothetical protein
MPRLRIRLAALGAVVMLPLAGATLLGAWPAWSQPAGPVGIDPAQLPETRGIIARYTLTPRGEVDGFLLRDGTQVHVPPHLSTQLVYTARPGDAVTVRGLRALGVPMVAAVSVTNDVGGAPVVDAGGPRGSDRRMVVQGRVQFPLRGPRGEINGAMLEDGTTLRLPPREAERFAELLQPGQVVAANGSGLVSALGTVVDVDEIGGSPNRLTEVGRPPAPRDIRGPDGRLPPPPPRG